MPRTVHPSSRTEPEASSSRTRSRRLTHRSVVALMSAGKTTPGVACGLSCLDAAPVTGHLASFT
jgi:hypothetical protein